MFGESLQLQIAAWIVAIDGLDQSHRGDRHQVFEKHFGWTAPVLAGRQEANLRHMRQDKLFTFKSR
jgi:hypothetical protein